MKVVRLVTLREDGSEVGRGDEVTSFRGDVAVFEAAVSPRSAGHSGKVQVAGRLYNDQVFRLTVVGMLGCGCPLHIVDDEGHQEGCEHAHRQPRPVRVTRHD